MNKSQFNIKISKDLLAKIKKQAIMSGKSLTLHITDLIIKSLSEQDIQDNQLYPHAKIKDLEERIIDIESIVSNREYLSQKPTPFTNSEAINCTKFMRSVFDKELERRNLNDKNHAFNDLCDHINIFNHLSETFTYRLREIMLNDKAKPWSAEDLNDFTNGVKCNCSIRKGLINWTDRRNFPSQQEICDKGEKLVDLF